LKGKILAPYEEEVVYPVNVFVRHPVSNSATQIICYNRLIFPTWGVQNKILLHIFLSTVCLIL